MTPISRDQAWSLLTEWVSSESLRRHCLAVEASMRACARANGQDEELWGVVGLLHDMDYERFPDLETGHPRMAIAELESRDVDPVITRAIASHADAMGVSRDSPGDGGDLPTRPSIGRTIRLRHERLPHAQQLH